MTRLPGSLLLLATLSIPATASAQTRHYPPISERQFKSGSIQVKVTGTWAMDDTIPINTMASITGEYTCNDVTSYDTGTRAMGKVVIVVKFTAGS